MTKWKFGRRAVIRCDCGRQFPICAKRTLKGNTVFPDLGGRLGSDKPAIGHEWPNVRLGRDCRLRCYVGLVPIDDILALFDRLNPSWEACRRGKAVTQWGGWAPHR